MALIRVSQAHTLPHPTGPRTHRFLSPDGQPLSWPGTTQSPKGTLLLRAGTLQKQLAGPYPGVANGADQLLGPGVCNVPQGHCRSHGHFLGDLGFLPPVPALVLHCLWGE